MKDLLSLGFGLNREMMTTVRLTTGGVCSLAGLNIDETEDCKVCVTEGLLLLLHRGYPYVRIRFSEDKGLSVHMEGEGVATANGVSAEDEISSALLSALAADVDMHKEEGCLRAIRFRFSK